MKNSKLYIDESTAFVYRVKSSDPYLKYMVCRHKKCKGIAKMMTHGEDSLICETRGHSHEPDPSFKAQKEFRAKLYQRAMTESTPLSVIHRELSASIFDMEVIRQMTFARVESAMLRRRNDVFPPVPDTLEDFGRYLEQPEYNPRFGQTLDGKPFFRQCRTGTALEGTVAIFISGHQELQDLLHTSDYYHIDGHFKMTPNVKNCYQLVTIMAVAYDEVFPVVSALMSRKTTAAYKMLFRCIKELFPDFKMAHVMSDFEKGLVRAVREEFPGAVLTGCLFHIDQAMSKKSAKLGLRPLLQERPEDAGKTVRTCMALPFLPANKIDDGFTQVRAQAARQDYYAQLKPFLDYVEKTWINGVGTAHMSVYRKHRRTNNDQESYHKTLVNSLGRPHANAWCWLETFRLHEATVWRKHIAASGGSAVSRCRKRKYRLLEDNIQRLYSKLERMSLLEFLGAASHFCKDTYSRVALREDVQGDVLELEDMEVPGGDPQDPLDPLGGEAEAVAPAPRGRTSRTRGGVRAARAAAADGAARGAARGTRGARNAGGARRNVVAQAEVEDMPNAEQEAPAPRDQPARGRARRPAHRGDLPAQVVANPEPEPAAQSVADQEAQAPQDERPRRRARAAVGETLPRVSRVTRRSPAVAVAREQRAVEREARAAQLERDAEAEANRQILQFQDELNAAQETHERQRYWRNLRRELEQTDNEEGLRVLATVPVVDENQATAEEYEIYNALRESEPVEVDTSNWRIVKCYSTDREFSRESAWQQVHELAQLVHLLPVVEDSCTIDEGDSCLCCVTSKPVRTCLPCGHKVLCHKCALKMFSTFSIRPDGGAVAKRCPVCNCIVGVVC